MTDSASSSDAQRNDPLKYIFGRTELDRIPRWGERDGISKYRQERLDREQLQPSNLASLHPIQRKVTELLGEWPSTKSFQELESDAMGVGFLLNLPYMIQKSAADEQQDLESAKSHLLQAYESKNDAVKALLDQAGLKSAIHKASRDPSRFPPFTAVIAPLLDKQLATDANLQVLFGEVSRVRGVLFELGPNIKEPPHPDSPAAAMLSPLLGQLKVTPGDRICGGCGAAETSSSPGNQQQQQRFSRCSGCRRIHYCGATCQKEHWPIHKPDCLVAQGKPVSNAVRKKAERTKASREEAAKNQKEEDHRQREADATASWRAFCAEDASQVDQYLYDCTGKRRRVHIPSAHGLVLADNLAAAPPAGIKFHMEERLSLGMFPDGIDSERYNFRGTLYSDPENGGAKIIFLFSYLYESAVEPAGCSGYYIDGIFVVDRVVEKRAKWKLVSEPRMDGPFSRFDFLMAYFKAAKDKAKAVSQDVDLGIHNPGDPPLELINTMSGDFMSLASNKIW